MSPRPYICFYMKYSLKALIVDDDPLIGELLHHFCKKSSRFSYSVAVERCGEALKLLSTEDFDLVFLDYNLPDMDGRSFLELVNPEIPVVMVTSESSFAADSYSYSQVKDFLTKPLSYERFLRIFERMEDSLVMEPVKNVSEVLFLKEGHATIRVMTEDIRFIKSEGNYLLIHLEDRKIMTLGALSKMEKDLPSFFCKNHRSYLVNLNFVTEVHPEEIRIGETILPLSQSHKSRLVEEWTNLQVR